MTEPLLCEVVSPPRPEDVFSRSDDRPWLLWLDSGEPGSAGVSARFSYLAVDPFRVLRGRNRRSEWVLPAGILAGEADPLTELEASLERYRVPPSSIPFCGGAGGFMGYELSGDLEALPRPACRDLELPDLELAFYDLVVVWDRAEDRCWIVSTGHPDDGPGRLSRARFRLEQAQRWLAGGPAPVDNDLSTVTGLPLTPTAAPPLFHLPGRSGIRSTFSDSAYRRAVRRAVEWILAGDVYQVNLSQRFELGTTGPAGMLYLRLRERSPAPFGAFFRATGGTILSTSPERFLRVDAAGKVQSRPIKGTRPRGEHPDEDSRLATELALSTKDRAENLMIVDLLRNDLSRVCEPASVRASELFRIESYATVHHLVSTIEGHLATGRSRIDLLRAAFPSGSVTGAPKIRSMEIISTLEPVARGPYCGALGFLGFGGEMDTSVSIRIAVSTPDRIVFHAGGAVIADSDPEAEYRETLHKAQAFLDVIGGESS